MPIDLLFRLARQTVSPLPLVFGATSGVPFGDVSLDADLGEVSFEALVFSMTIARIAADFDQLQFMARASQIVPALNDLLFRQPPLVAPPVDLLFETMH